MLTGRIVISCDLRHILGLVGGPGGIIRPGVYVGHPAGDGLQAGHHVPEGQLPGRTGAGQGFTPGPCGPWAGGFGCAALALMDSLSQASRGV